MMVPPRVGTPSGPWVGCRLALWTAVAVGLILPSVGCQVEYAGMTLPSGKYMRDDVQYFPPGPDFPWANTQAATQRARMRSMGMEVPSADPVGGIARPPAAGGALAPVQNIPNMPTNVNTMLNPPGAPMPGAAAPPPPGGAPAMPIPAGEDSGGLPFEFAP